MDSEDTGGVTASETSAVPGVSDHASPKATHGRQLTRWQNDPIILARMREVERGYAAGKFNVEIARELGVDEGTVRNDLKRLITLWRERTGSTVEEVRAKRIAALEEIHRTAMEYAQFDRATEQAIIFGVVDEHGRPVEVRTDDRGSVQFRGNKAAALNVARQAQMDIAKLQGAIVDKIAPTDPDGRALNLAELVKLARE